MRVEHVERGLVTIGGVEPGQLIHAMERPNIDGDAGGLELDRPAAGHQDPTAEGVRARDGFVG